MHPGHLPIACLDVISAFPVFPAADHVTAGGAFDEYWLVMAHREEVMREKGYFLSSGGLSVLLNSPYIPRRETM